MSDTPRVVLMMSPGGGYDRGLLRGIARFARNHGPWVFILAGDEPCMPMSMAAIAAVNSVKGVSLSSRCHDGLLLNLKKLGATGFIGRLNNPRVAEAVLASGLPAIAMDLTDNQLVEDNPLSRLSEICPDSHKAGQLAAEHLLDRGFRRFAFCGYQGENWSHRREVGFCQRLKKAGFECDVYPLPPRKTRLPWHREQPIVTAWLKSLYTPVGIMACNDIRGRQILEACAIGEMHVPDDVAVVGVDEDHLLSELSNPPLSSVVLDTEKGGYQAAELLNEMMSGRLNHQRRTILVNALWVVARPSTDVIAVEDRDVAAAILYIRDNARRPIGVRDVVKHAAISRRALEIRFLHILKRSIREEIQRVRLNWVQQMLVETNMPIWKIADCTGFSSLSYLRKVFHRTVGATLVSYRKKHRSL